MVTCWGRGLQERVAELERQKRAQEWAWQDKVATMETDMRQKQVELEQSLWSLTSSHSHLQQKLVSSTE